MSFVCSAVAGARPLLGAIAALTLFLSAGAAVAADRQAAIVIDAGTRQVLYADDADALRYPASLTKIMTLFVTFDALDRGRLRPGQKLYVSQHAASQAPSSLGLRPGQTIALDDAIMGVVTKSANDAAVVLAEAIAGSESAFADQMTRRARQLGMASTTFRNASGLPNPDQRTTARDMATLAVAMLQHHAGHYRVFSTREFVFQGRVYGNHNKLLGNYEGTDGIKTGFINASGFNRVASVRRGERRLVGVVFGGNTGRERDAEMMRLLDAGFSGQLRGREELRTAAVAPPVAVEPASPTRARAARTVSQVADALNPIGTANAATTQRFEQGSGDYRTGWSVQVGAFSRPAAAELEAVRVIDRMPTAFSNTQATPMAVEDTKRKLHRARIGNLSEAEARDACRKLSRSKMTCLVVPPQG